MKSYKIGELAGMVDLSIDTIRYYEKIGLIPAPQRQANDYRLYSEEYISILEFIKTSKNNGFKLKEVASIMILLKKPKRNKSKIQTIVIDKVASIDKQIKELIDLKNQLNDIVKYCIMDEECTIINAIEEKDKN